MATNHDIEKQELEIELMKVQIDKTRLDIEKIQREMRWEPWKALATMLTSILLATAAMTTAVVALAHWLASSMVK